MATSSYNSQFPNKIYPGNIQSERGPSTDPRVAEARDYNIHDKEIRQIQLYIGTGLAGSISDISQKLIDDLDGFQLEDAKAGDWLTTNPNTACGGSWGLGSSATLDDLLTEIVYGTGILDAELLCNLSTATGTIVIDHQSTPTVGSTSVGVVGDNSDDPNIGMPITVGSLSNTLLWAGLNVQAYDAADGNAPSTGIPPALYSSASGALDTKDWMALGGQWGIIAPEGGRVLNLTLGPQRNIREGAYVGSAPFYHYDAPGTAQDWTGPLHFRFDSFSATGTSPTGTMLDGVPPGEVRSGSMVYGADAVRDPEQTTGVINLTGEYLPWYIYPFEVTPTGSDNIWQIPPGVVILQFPPFQPGVPGLKIFPSGVHIPGSGMIHWCDEGQALQGDPAGGLEAGPAVEAGPQDAQNNVINPCWGWENDRFRWFRGVNEGTVVPSVTLTGSGTIAEDDWKGHRHIRVQPASGTSDTLTDIEGGVNGDKLTLWFEGSNTITVQGDDMGPSNIKHSTTGDYTGNQDFDHITYIYQVFQETERWVEEYRVDT